MVVLPGVSTMTVGPGYARVREPLEQHVEVTFFICLSHFVFKKWTIWANNIKKSLQNFKCFQKWLIWRYFSSIQVYCFASFWYIRAMKYWEVNGKTFHATFPGLFYCLTLKINTITGVIKASSFGHWEICSLINSRFPRVFEIFFYKIFIQIRHTPLTLKCHLEQLFLIVVICLIVSSFCFFIELLIHRSQVCLSFRS